MGRGWGFVAFIAGFTTVFLLATVSVFGALSAINANAETLQRVGGVVTILMGVVFLGGVRFLQRDTRVEPKKWSTWVGAPLLGRVCAGLDSVFGADSCSDHFDFGRY